MSGGIKVGMKCEVCTDLIAGRHREVIEVGRKPNGVPRVIHDRPRCRAHWHRSGDKIKAGWVENRGRVAVAGLEVERAPLLTEQFGGAPVPPVPKSKEERVKPTTVVRMPEQPVLAMEMEPTNGTHRNPRFKWKPETEAAVLAYFAGQPVRHGDGYRCHDFLRRTQPALVIDEDGREINAQSFSRRCSVVIARAGQRITPDSGNLDRAAIIEKEIAEDRAQRAEQRADTIQRVAGLAAEICAEVWKTAGRLDAPTLETLADLLGVKEGK